MRRFSSFNIGIYYKLFHPRYISDNNKEPPPYPYLWYNHENSSQTYHTAHTLQDSTLTKQTVQNENFDDDYYDDDYEDDDYGYNKNDLSNDNHYLDHSEKQNDIYHLYDEIETLDQSIKKIQIDSENSIELLAQCLGQIKFDFDNKIGILNKSIKKIQLDSEKSTELLDRCLDEINGVKKRLSKLEKHKKNKNKLNHF